MKEQEAGEHTVKFNGSGLASGIYFYIIAAGISGRCGRWFDQVGRH